MAWRRVMRMVGSGSPKEFVDRANVAAGWMRCKLRRGVCCGKRAACNLQGSKCDGGSQMVEMPMVAKGAEELYLLPGMTNRHGLVAGATGTGKTVTLQVMAEALSSIGVPVFAADVKGDLSGISQPGKASPKFDERIKTLGFDEWSFTACPVVFWDV